MVDRGYAGRNVSPTEAGTQASEAIRRREQQAAAAREQQHQRNLANATKTQNTGEKNSGCFIATAAFGNYDAPEVLVLRAYRDNYLSKSWLGRGFIDFYYSISPPLAALLDQSPLLRQMTRGAFLTPVVYLMRQAGINPNKIHAENEQPSTASGVRSPIATSREKHRGQVRGD